MDKKEVRKTIRGLFKKNGDADGKIKKEDLRKLLEEAFASHEKKDEIVGKIMDAADGDEVTLRQLRKSMAKSCDKDCKDEELEKAMMDLFEEYDEDDSGVLEKAEFEKMINELLENHPKKDKIKRRAMKRLQKSDNNISKDEFEKVMPLLKRLYKKKLEDPDSAEDE
ncbi:uncharacterized protein AB9X84_023368 isoform 1-T2 [Acanthopagrus schlegelii]